MFDWVLCNVTCRASAFLRHESFNQKLLYIVSSACMRNSLDGFCLIGFAICNLLKQMDSIHKNKTIKKNI